MLTRPHSLLQRTKLKEICPQAATAHLACSCSGSVAFPGYGSGFLCRNGKLESFVLGLSGSSSSQQPSLIALPTNFPCPAFSGGHFTGTQLTTSVTFLSPIFKVLSLSMRLICSHFHSTSSSVYLLYVEAPRLSQVELWSLSWKPQIEYIPEAVILRDVCC